MDKTISGCKKIGGCEKGLRKFRNPYIAIFIFFANTVSVTVLPFLSSSSSYTATVGLQNFATCEIVAKFRRFFPLDSGPPLLQKFDTNCKNKHRKFF